MWRKVSVATAWVPFMFPPTPPPLRNWTNAIEWHNRGSNARRGLCSLCPQPPSFECETEGLLATTTVRLTPPTPLNMYHPSGTRMMEGFCPHNPPFGTTSLECDTTITLRLKPTTPPSNTRQRGFVAYQHPPFYTTPSLLEMRNGGTFWPPPPFTSVTQSKSEGVCCPPPPSVRPITPLSFFRPPPPFVSLCLPPTRHIFGHRHSLLVTICLTPVARQLIFYGHDNII